MASLFPGLRSNLESLAPDQSAKNTATTTAGQSGISAGSKRPAPDDLNQPGKRTRIMPEVFAGLKRPAPDDLNHPRKRAKDTPELSAGSKRPAPRPPQLRMVLSDKAWPLDHDIMEEPVWRKLCRILDCIESQNMTVMVMDGSMEEAYFLKQIRSTVEFLCDDWKTETEHKDIELRDCLHKDFLR